MRRLLQTRPLIGARAALVRVVGLLVALAIAGHAAAKFLVSGHGGGEWAYLVLSLAIAGAVWGMTGRGAVRVRRRRAEPANPRGRARGR